MTTRDLLINQLSKIPSLNGRYIDVQCINYPPPSGENKRGFFSLVFYAIDKISGEPVAIKFMDPEGTKEVYRLNCFKREPQILQQLNGKKRCLRLVEGLQNFNIEVETTTGDKFPILFEFFSTGWIDEDIDDFFLAREDLSPLDKLYMFRLIVLALEAVHKSNVFHRDLKPDNIRGENNQGTRCAYIIDFGTAAQFDSNKLLPGYAAQVGASLYSAPEAFLGFAGERDIAKYTDFYALGCMLYELFNKQLFFEVLLNKNPNFLQTLSVLAMEFSRYPTKEIKLSVWNETLNKFTKTVSPPEYLDVGCDLPSAISDLISKLFKNLIAFDFNTRLSNFGIIIKSIDTAITVLRNDKIEKSKKQKKIIFKENKINKIKAKEARLSEYLKKRSRLTC